MRARREPGDLQIRRATKDDVPQLVLLEKECFESYYKDHRFSGADFVNYIHKKGAVFLVAARPPSLVGYVAGYVRSYRSSQLARIDSVAVSKETRGKGVGTRLMNRFMEQVRRAGCRAITLEVAAANEDGLHFFGDLGYLRIRRLCSHYGKGIDGIRMRRALS